MSIFQKAIPAKKPRTTNSQKIAYAYAAVLVILILSQLFTFDDFIRLIESFWLPGGMSGAHLLGSSIIACELLALPFLLRIDLSRLMRIICMVLSWLVPLIWFGLSLWVNLTVNAISNIGFLGSLVQLAPGWWAVLVCVALGILSAWASWGLWPGKRK
jgi:hypothetical protein